MWLCKLTQKFSMSKHLLSQCFSHSASTTIHIYPSSFSFSFFLPLILLHHHPHPRHPHSSASTRICNVSAHKSMCQDLYLVSFSFLFFSFRLLFFFFLQSSTSSHQHVVRSGPSEGRGQRQPNNQHPSDCDNARRGPPKLR